MHLETGTEHAFLQSSEAVYVFPLFVALELFTLHTQKKKRELLSQKVQSSSFCWQGNDGIDQTFQTLSSIVGDMSDAERQPMFGGALSRFYIGKILQTLEG